MRLFISLTLLMLGAIGCAEGASGGDIQVQDSSEEPTEGGEESPLEEDATTGESKDVWADGETEPQPEDDTDVEDTASEPQPLDTTSPGDATLSDGGYEDTGTNDSLEEPEVTTPDGEGSPLAPCEEQLGEPLQWFDEAEGAPLLASLEFGQTHIIREVDDRSAPLLGAERETLLLVSPDAPLLDSAQARVAAFEGNTLLGVVPLMPPSALPPSLEEGLTVVPIEPYSLTTWSASLPWNWVREGVQLRIGVKEGDAYRVLEKTLTNLASPHVFTLTRTHMVLFGKEDFPVIPPNPTSKITQEFGSAIPGSEFRWVNTTPWRLDSMVVNTPEGPRPVYSEEERLEKTTDPNRWNILKHQAALRLSLANTGRGLRLTSPPEGDSSPYSFGTSMAQGWVETPEGEMVDINNAGLAAGWTGWSGMWINECGNGFIHELGHTFTLLHFTEGTADSWGIGDEYPQDGVFTDSHPWGYDTVKRMLRTWYRVDASGPVMNETGLQGKRDPMNGGESPNSLTCFPPYTAYHGQQIQQWLQSSPTLMNKDGIPGVYRWQSDTSSYVKEPAPAGNQEPIAVDKPTVTFIGTLGNIDDACQTYPPLFSTSGNSFELPDPTAETLHESYLGAHWFVEVSYENNEVERGLINRGLIPQTDTGLSLYSLNVELEKTPTEIRLFRSSDPYPEMDVEGAELVHSRTVELPETLPPVVRLGRGYMANYDMGLHQWCEPGVNCETRDAETHFLEGSGSLTFSPVGQEMEPVWCHEDGDLTSWEVPVVADTGIETTLTIHAQRVISTTEGKRAIPAHDATPWAMELNGTQSLRTWIPYAENAELPPGYYQLKEPFLVNVMKEGTPHSTLNLNVTLQVWETLSIAIPPNYTSEGLSIGSGEPDSSIYYVFQDPLIGPTGGDWWGDSAGTLIYVPVLDSEDNSLHILTMRAHKVACGDWWGINTGQVADWGCNHQVHLQLEDGANDTLISGHSYSTPASTPVVIQGLRWHQPNAGQVLGTLSLQITHEAP